MKKKYLRDSPWRLTMQKRVSKEQISWSQNKISIRYLGTLRPSLTVLFGSTVPIWALLFYRCSAMHKRQNKNFVRRKIKKCSKVSDARPQANQASLEKINEKVHAEMTCVFVHDLFSFLLRLSSFGSSHVCCLLN